MLCASSDVLLRPLGLVDYAPTFAAMRSFTQQRGADTPDEIWFCQHLPVYTLGLAGRREHLLAPGTIPVLASDRGGQVTYHGPGQVIAYPLLDLQRAGYLVKAYVFRLEEALLRTLRDFQVTGHRVAGAPGIYVRLAAPFDHSALSGPVSAVQRFAGLGKIAALGLKLQRHCSYHGLALNVAMDLEPFARIDPCGYKGLQTVDLSTIGVQVSTEAVQTRLMQHLVDVLFA